MLKASAISALAQAGKNMAFCKKCEVETKGSVVQLLNKVLADCFVLYVKTLNFHWNVVGPHFNHVHKLFGDLYTALGLTIDTLAEHIRSMDERPLAMMSEFLEHSESVMEETPTDCSDRNLVSVLARDFKAVTNYISAVVHRIDADFQKDSESNFYVDSTIDMLTAMLQEFEKNTWMLKSSQDGQHG